MVFYMDLDADAVRAVMPATNAGAKDPLIDEYLDERQLWLTRRLGGTLPTEDKVIRGVLRDLAAAAAIRKLATNDEERRAADGLRNDAMERLLSYENYSHSPDSVKHSTLVNVTPDSLWDAPYVSERRW